jgi:hypothetical protein
MYKRVDIYHESCLTVGAVEPLFVPPHSLRLTLNASRQVPADTQQGEALELFSEQK